MHARTHTWSWLSLRRTLTRAGTWVACEVSAACVTCSVECDDSLHTAFLASSVTIVYINTVPFCFFNAVDRNIRFRISFSHLPVAKGRAIALRVTPSIRVFNFIILITSDRSVMVIAVDCSIGSFPLRSSTVDFAPSQTVQTFLEYPFLEIPP